MSLAIAAEFGSLGAPAELRGQLDGLTDKALLERCAGMRPGAVDTTTASMKHALRALAKRWLTLDAEIHAHDRGVQQRGQLHSASKPV